MTLSTEVLITIGWSKDICHSREDGNLIQWIPDQVRG